MTEGVERFVATAKASSNLAFKSTKERPPNGEFWPARLSGEFCVLPALKAAAPAVDTAKSSFGLNDPETPIAPQRMFFFFLFYLIPISKKIFN
jgi:hypothetical protein